MQVISFLEGTKLRKIILGALAAITLVLSGGAFAAQAEPGPNGSNDKGLCTAYFNGQKEGHGDGEDPANQPKPFDGLESAGEAYTDSDGKDNDRDGKADETDQETRESEELTGAENVFNYCNSIDGIGGKPEHGRFTCTVTGGTSTGEDTSTDPECNENEEPGKADDK